jgi:uncharacterized glyoxalase superfamily protein PhnB
MFKKLTTNMIAADVAWTAGYYMDVLGFEFVMGVPKDSQEIIFSFNREQPLDFAMVGCGGVEVMFQARESISGEIPGLGSMEIGASVTFYIEVEDVEEIFKRLEGKVEMIKGLETTFYGMEEFYIRDCNGYILAFVERV